MECTSGGSVAGRTREIREYFHCIQQAHREVGVKVRKHLLEILSTLAGEPIAVPSPATTLIAKRLELQRSALYEEVGCSQERISAHESELAAERNYVKAKLAELKRYLNSSAARARFLEGSLRVPKLLRLKRFAMLLIELLLMSPLGWTLFSER